MTVCRHGAASGGKVLGGTQGSGETGGGKEFGGKYGSEYGKGATAATERQAQLNGEHGTEKRGRAHDTGGSNELKGKHGNRTASTARDDKDLPTARAVERGAGR